MAVNPVGYVPVFDGGIPRIITAYAAVGVTGGQFVYFSGAQNVVSSGADSFIASDLQIIGVASGTNFNGVVVTPGTTASGTNNYVGVMTMGAGIFTADNTVTAGQGVQCAGVDSIQSIGSLAADANGIAGQVNKKIGRAWTNAASGGYAVAFINP